MLWPSKYSTSTCNALMPTLETFLELHFRYSSQSHLKFFLSAAKRVPEEFFLLVQTEKNRRKPYEANSIAVRWYPFRSVCVLSQILAFWQISSRKRLKKLK